MPRPFASAVEVEATVRAQLESLVRARSTPQSLAFRCRLILRAAVDVAQEQGRPQAVGQAGQFFVEDGEQVGQRRGRRRIAGILVRDGDASLVSLAPRLPPLRLPAQAIGDGVGMHIETAGRLGDGSALEVGDDGGEQ